MPQTQNVKAFILANAEELEDLSLPIKPEKGLEFIVFHSTQKGLKAAVAEQMGSRQAACIVFELVPVKAYRTTKSAIEVPIEEGVKFMESNND